MEETKKKQMVTSDRSSNFREVNSYPKRSVNSSSTIRKYLREVQSKNVTTVTGLERGEEHSTRSYVEDTKEVGNYGSTFSNKLEKITQSLNTRNEVKVKKEIIDEAVKDSVWEIDDNTTDYSTDNEASSNDSDTIDSESEKVLATGKIDEDIQDLEKQLRKTIPSDRRPWESGGSRKKIKKFYSDVVEFQKTSINNGTPSKETNSIDNTIGNESKETYEQETDVGINIQPEKKPTPQANCTEDYIMKDVEELTASDAVDPQGINNHEGTTEVKTAVVQDDIKGAYGNTVRKETTTEGATRGEVTSSGDPLKQQQILQVPTTEDDGMEVEQAHSSYTDADIKRLSSINNGQSKGYVKAEELLRSPRRVPTKLGKGWMDHENDPGESMSEDSSDGEFVDDSPKTIWEDLELLEKEDIRKQNKQRQYITKEQKTIGDLRRNDNVNHGRISTVSSNKRSKSVQFSDKKTYRIGYYNEGRKVINLNSPSSIGQTKRTENETHVIQQKESD